METIALTTTTCEPWNKGKLVGRKTPFKLRADGWQLQRTRGSHHQFVHPIKPGTVTVPHPKKDLGKGLVRAIRKQAGLR